MPTDRAQDTVIRWLVVDHDRDDQTVRGPYDSATTAAAVRRELERDGYYAESGNLWIVPAGPDA